MYNSSHENMTEENMSSLVKSFSILLFLNFPCLAMAANDVEIGCLRGDCISGYGILVEETERGLTHYRGEFREGQYHGNGRLEFLDGGEIYKGNWMLGKKQGRGTMINRSDSWSLTNKVFDVYVGNWRNDRRNGQGTQAYAVKDWVEDRNTASWLVENTENYTGNFLNDIISGQGTYRWSDGTKYTGGWAANKKHGRGYFDFGTGLRSERIFEFDVQVDF
tara:strand:- start:6309 stop:6968 length:660 start_codon:yes stop_codon:yes gene_type:complete